MNGVHDLGGMHGFGHVEREPNEPVFHAEWEGRVFAIVRAALAQGLYTVDELRRAIEEIQPARYLASAYYERWLASAEANLAEKGVITAAELDARMRDLAAGRTADVSRSAGPELADLVVGSLRARPDYRRPGPPPSFRAGDRVRARNRHPRHHTRLPRYARGKEGVIHAVHGTYVFPDTSAHARGEHPEPLYSVRFDARELWSDSAEPRHGSVYLDLWESYLEPVGGS